jgi:hypothetical protein
VVAGLLLAIPALAVDLLRLELGRIEGPDWQAESVALSIDWQSSADVAAFQLVASNVHHPLLSAPLERIEIQCSEGAISDREIRCAQGLLQLPHPALDRPNIPLSFRLQLPSQALDLALQPVHLADGALELKLASDATGWRLQAAGKGLNLAKLKALAADFVALPEGLELEAKSDFSLDLHGRNSEPTDLRYRVELSEAAFSDPSAEYLADGLAARLSGDLALRDGVWQGKAAVEMTAGAILTPFLYLEPGRRPVMVQTALSFDPVARRLELASLEYQHPGVLELGLSARLMLGDEPQVEQLRLQARPFDLQALYAGYVQPTQAGSLLARLKWQGQAALDLDYLADGAQRLALDLMDVHLDEVLPPPVEGVEELAPRRSLGLYGVSGRLIWTQGRAPEPSRIAWQGGHLLESLTLGEAALALGLEGPQVRLLEPAQIPLLDGGLSLQHLALSTGEQGPRLEFDGALAPISMETFSQAMGWPTLAGTLSGGISGATYEQGVLTVGGSIVTNLFGGWVGVRNLRMEDMFGVWPLLHADLEFRELDLQTLTSTFSFGKITGKLEGRIDGLYLENWRPVSFDARFATPADDDSRHRISQRAVDNISNLGGSGVSGALSRSFLRFFEEFGYDRLGITCRLKNGVCEMGGVGPAKQGYYLVKGGGVPRIDIVGFNRRIDWELLVQKLVEITESGDPVIQ